jgi:hypothetical protein
MNPMAFLGQFVKFVRGGLHRPAGSAAPDALWRTALREKEIGIAKRKLKEGG